MYIKKFVTLQLLLSPLLFCLAIADNTFPIIKRNSDLAWTFEGRYKPESFYGHNTNLLNSCNNWDNILFSRHTLDINTDVAYGLNTFGHTAAEFKCTMRNKGIWGDPHSNARTSETETKTIDSIERPHYHYIPRHLFWIRECWLELSLADALQIPKLSNHTFTIGAFPFMLGRGIALGDAYAVGPETLGFYTDAAIDQYAFGAKLSGELAQDTLFYELYTAILENKTGSLSHTGAHMRNQEIGRMLCPQRGFGRMNMVYAGHLFWHALNSDYMGHLVVEPYVMYNKDPEQKIEFRGDASSGLGTVGLALEFEQSWFEFGFDVAFNMGHQSARGWDRNVVEEAAQLIIEDNVPARSVLVFQNSHVVDENDTKIPHDQSSNWGKAIQKAIDIDAIESQHENGKHIATVINPDNNAQSVELFNASNRFRDTYRNSYHGYMFVSDFAINFCNKDLQWAVTAGIASGDRNPNEELIDQDFKGFIGIQELYSGKRVKSAFMFGGAGKLQRPLAAPVDEAPSTFAKTVSGFTDIKFFGTGLKWEPTGRNRRYTIHPNILAYWKDATIPKFDASTGKEAVPCAPARNFLGTEIALFAHVFLFDNLSLFGIASIFVPGGHYADIKGKPLNKDQQKALDRADRSGFAEGKIPNISDNVAFTANVGLEFRF